MNRTRRRKAGVKKKTTTYNFIRERSRVAVSEGMEEYKDRIRGEVTNQTLRVVAYAPLLVPHDKWGSGKKRPEEFLLELVEQIDCLGKDHARFGDMTSVIKDETDLDVSEYIKFRGDRSWMDKL